MLVQHHFVVHMKERLLTEKPTSRGPGYKPWASRQQNAAPKYGYIGYGYGEDDVEGADQGRPHEERHNRHVAVMPAGSADDEEVWLDDEDVAVQLNAYAAVASELEEDTLGDECAQAVQPAYAGPNTRSQAKGKGQGQAKDK